MSTLRNNPLLRRALAFQQTNTRLFSSQKRKNEVDDYLRRANAAMRPYHEHRELARAGKLAPHPSNVAWRQERNKTSNDGDRTIVRVYVATLVFFLSALALKPWLGRKLARDEEFREAYGPYLSWILPTNAPTLGTMQGLKPWTQQELHEQRIAVELALRRRALNGEGEDDDNDGSTTVWDEIHPGLEKGEKWNEA